MFFTTYNPLTPEYVEEKAKAIGAAAGGGCGCLNGLKFEVKLDGQFAPAKLAYEIKDEKELVVTENDATYTAPYSSICQGPITIMTHLIPGTSRGWHLVIDRRTWAVTAFETWFGITVPVGLDLFGAKKEPDYYSDIPREIQREYYFGWLDMGNNEKPEKLHTTTNRIEGRGLYWKYDTGYEILTFNPSTSCTTFTELGAVQGGITVTNPADYIRIDDENYIYARWEVEFSGKMWIEVMNFFDFTAAGMEFGFEKDDSLTYKLHRAELELTGDAAHLEKINSFGDKERPMAATLGKKKGGRYSYRPMDIDVPMPREEAHAHAAEKQTIFGRGQKANIMGSKNNLDFNYDLVGKEFKVWADNEKYAQAPWSGYKGTPWEYKFIDKETLQWRYGDMEWQTEYYTCFQPDKKLYHFAHLMTGDPDYSMVSHVIDLQNGLATIIKAGIGNWQSEWEAGANVQFGTVEYGDLKAPFARRHHFTDELLGQCFAWAYTETMNSIHVYSSPESYSWTIFGSDNGGGATWSSPCFYIKLRPDVYLFQWVEEKCNGSQGLVVINRKIQHDGGFFYGVSHAGLSLSITGAYMRELGKFDIAKYFDRIPGIK